MILSASLVKICICLSTSSDQSNQIQLSFVKQYIFKVQDLFFMRNNKNTFLKYCIRRETCVLVVVVVSENKYDL